MRTGIEIAVAEPDRERLEAIVEGVLGFDAEAEHDGVCVVVREGTEAVEFFLACCVPEGELDVHVVYEDVWEEN